MLTLAAGQITRSSSEVFYAYSMKLNRYNNTKTGKIAKCFVIPDAILFSFLSYLSIKSIRIADRVTYSLITLVGTRVHRPQNPLTAHTPRQLSIYTTTKKTHIIFCFDMKVKDHIAWLLLFLFVLEGVTGMAPSINTDVDPNLTRCDFSRSQFN